MDRIFKIRCSQIGKIMSNAKKEGELSQTCKTYLHEWYANDNDEIFSKYIDKGNQVEIELIDFMAEQLGFGMAEKNQVRMTDEYFTGECDVIMPKCIIDVKAAWNVKSLHDNVITVNTDYIWQGHGYMHLYDKPEFILFHGLLNTPEDANYGTEITFDHIPVNERWSAYKFLRDDTLIESIKLKVVKCREYLEEYDKLIKSKIGQIQPL